MRIPVAVKIAGIYLAVGSLWIFFSDRLLNLLVDGQIDSLTHFQTLKGWFYVIATAGMLYWLIERESKISREATKKLKNALVELRTTQVALQKNQAQFSAFMDYSPAAFWITDSEGRVEYVSPAYIRMFQVPTNLLGEHIVNLYPQDIAQIYLENMQTVTQTGEVLETIEPGIRSDGQLGQFLVYKFPLPQPDGHQYVGGVALDVTEWKQAESVLYQREQEFRALVENAPDIIVRFDRNLRHLYVNPAITVATGLPPQSFIGKTNQDLGMPAAQVALWDATFNHVFTSGEQQRMDFQFPSPEGVRDYQARCVPEFTTDGSVISALVVARDITGQKQLERALRQHAERLELTSAIAQRIRQSLNLKDILNTTVIEVKQLLQCDRVIVYQFAPDMGGTVVAESVAAGWRISLGSQIVDTCFQSVTGAGGDYRQGKKRAIANIDHAGLSACHWQLLQQFEVQASLVVPILLMGAGEETPAQLWGLLIAHQCAAPREWHADQVDLLDQIALQLAIAIQQAQVFERAQMELAERQQAEKHLRAALAEKEVLLKEIHHRVKNNLQIVSGLLQLQAHGLTDPQIVNALRESQARVESMSLIHKKLYTASDLGQIDVVDYIQTLAISLLTTYQIQPGTVALRVEVEPVILSLDQAIPCGLIINELVSNALKYAFSPQAVGEILVKLYQVEAQLELTIQDNGIGLPEHIHWQTTESLGLSLVYALATEQLDGNLTVDRNGGTRFTIKFPQAVSKK